ncbi:MAG: glycosyltransferase family 2 protein, partial [Wenzhouxiangellaceae bacterium]
DWELVVVHDDDGIGLEWLNVLRDARIRVLSNQFAAGRGGARQTALAASRGRYLAFLDADDWMYPRRLEHQSGLLDEDDSLALVSAGMTVVDDDERPVGARKAMNATRIGDSEMLDSPVLNASSMIRGPSARRMRYDTALESGEDCEFLARYLRGRRYRQEAAPLYCYREFASFSVAGLRSGLAAERRRHLRQAREQAGWLRMLRRAAVWGFKRAVYELLLKVGGRGLVLRRRCRALTVSELRTHQAAERDVRAMLNSIPGPTA